MGGKNGVDESCVNTIGGNLSISWMQTREYDFKESNRYGGNLRNKVEKKKQSDKFVVNVRGLGVMPWGE